MFFQNQEDLQDEHNLNNQGSNLLTGKVAGFERPITATAT